MASRAPISPDEPLAADGRVARGQRTRRRVAEALLALLAEGGPEPTARAVADRAGVSLRLVFHHFEDVEDLYRSVCELQYERHWRNVPQVPPTLSLPRRTDRTARVRGGIYEQVAPARRAGLRRIDRSPQLAALFEASHQVLRDGLRSTFAPELDPLPPSASSDLLSAIDAVTSWEAWEQLRRAQSLSVATARRVMGRSLLAILEAQSAPGAGSGPRTKKGTDQ